MSRKDGKEVSLGTPGDLIKDPRATNYARSIQQRRAQPAPTYAEPVAGGPTPHIPLMANQPVIGGQQSIVEQTPRAVGVSPGSMGLLPGDLLPEEVRKDPLFRDGHGSMYAAAQPNLAFKYGIMRNGQHLMPQQLRPGPRRPASETVADLQKLAELRQATESGESAVEQESAAGTGGAAARLANAPGDTDVRPIAGEDKEKLERARKALENMDEFDFDSFRQAVMKDLLNNEEQRKIIEDRLEPLSLDDYISKGFILQRVPVIPGKFEPTFRSLTAEDDLSLKRLIMQDSKSLAQVSDRYLLDKFSLMSVACMTHAINTHIFPSHLNQNGDFDDDLFWKKFNLILKQGFHMLASLGVNGFWFDVRVRKLFVAENLKNG